MTKIAGSGSASGSISQRHGSADPDPDPPQNVMDPQHWLQHFVLWITVSCVHIFLLFNSLRFVQREELPLSNPCRASSAWVHGWRQCSGSVTFWYLRIRMRIRILGSVPLTNWSGSCSFRQFFTKFSCLFFFEGTFTSFFKKSLRSHKTVEIKISKKKPKKSRFFLIFCLLTDPYK